MDEIELTQQIYNELKLLRIVANQTEFSRLCGRTPMWFSCIKARKLPLSADAALTLAYRLRRIAKNSLSINEHNKLFNISERLLRSAHDKVERNIENFDVNG